MLKFLGHGLRYAVSLSALAAVGLAVRYAGSWSPTNPVDPTRQMLRLGSPAAPEFPVSPAVIQADDRRTIWEVAFVTAHDLDEFDTTAELHFGVTEVTIPAARIRGAMELADETSAKRKRNTATIRRAPARTLEENDFYRHLAGRSPTDVLVFVHGYNVSFDEAVCRVAQMAHDMPFSGLIVAYDWKSQGETAGYLRDQQTVDASYRDFAATLARLRTELSAATRLHVLAHSMGNRITLSALQHLEWKPKLIGNGREPASPSNVALLQPPHPEWSQPELGASRTPPLTHLVFAAPDVGPEQFEAALSTIAGAAKFMTLYSSDTDFALEASRIVHGQGRDSYRTGDSRSNVRCANLQTIRLTGVNRSDPFGHSYYGSHPGLLTDLAHLLQRDVPPGERATVVADQEAWRLR